MKKGYGSKNTKKPMKKTDGMSKMGHKAYSGAYGKKKK